MAFAVLDLNKITRILFTISRGNLNLETHAGNLQRMRKVFALIDDINNVWAEDGTGVSNEFILLRTPSTSSTSKISYFSGC